MEQDFLKVPANNPLGNVDRENTMGTEIFDLAIQDIVHFRYFSTRT